MLPSVLNYVQVRRKTRAKTFSTGFDLGRRPFEGVLPPTQARRSMHSQVLPTTQGLARRQDSKESPKSLKAELEVRAQQVEESRSSRVKESKAELEGRVAAEAPPHFLSEPAARSHPPPPLFRRAQSFVVRAPQRLPSKSRVTTDSLKNVMHELALEVQPWLGQDFIPHSRIQTAERDFGQGDPMESKTWGLIAVKLMPTNFITKGHSEFMDEYPSSIEQPWLDFALVRTLETLRYPYVNKLLGIFRDHDTTYVASPFAAEGGLFKWSKKGKSPGLEREAEVLPFALQILDAVRALHDLGIAHRDISLENILITGGRIKIVDFGMATLQRMCTNEVRGKPSCTAPEMHLDAEYDAFLADAFSVGVVIFAMATREYPWLSTEQGCCPLFEARSRQGFVASLLKRRNGSTQGRQQLFDVLSRGLLELLEALLFVDPRERACLGEVCFKGQLSRASIWLMAWLSSARL
ncbi:unnamed protein product [Polarella glacialis]|uniref:Protein kinase domain-containing protein n=1 Tax=Polarella glacialis TaxID=89957 RepID=A0A813L3V9_POLGL|nr:unnamed protein product [Polarella glacialis]